MLQDVLTHKEDRYYIPKFLLATVGFFVVTHDYNSSAQEKQSEHNSLLDLCLHIPNQNSCVQYKASLVNRKNRH